MITESASEQQRLIIDVFSDEEDEEFEHQNVKNSNSWLQSSCILVANQLGMGVLGIPTALAETGLIAGCVTLTLMTLIAMYCGSVIGKLRGNDRNVRTYGHLTEKGFNGSLHARYGKVGKAIVNGIGYAYMLGCNTVYIVAIRISLSLIFFSENHEINKNYWLLISVGILIPIAQFRDLQKISFVSIIGVLTIALVDVVMVYRLINTVVHNDQPPSTEEPVEFTFLSFINGVSSCAFAFGGVIIFVPVLSAMRKPRQFPTAVSVAQVFMFINYIAIGVVGYLAYGAGELKNYSPITKAFSSTDALSKVTNVSIVIHVLISYCIGNQVLAEAYCTYMWPQLFHVHEVAPVKRKRKRKESNATPSGYNAENSTPDFDVDIPGFDATYNTIATPTEFKENTRNILTDSYDDIASDIIQQVSSGVMYGSIILPADKWNIRGKWAVTSITLLGIAALIAFAIPNFEDLLAIFACIGVFTLSFGIPPLLQLLFSRGKLPWYIITLDVLLCVSSTFFCCVGMYAAAYNVILKWPK